MTIAKIVSGLGVVVMTIVIGYALIAGDFNAEGALLTSMPWGIVSLVDLYTGFTLFSMWIIFREKSLWRSVVWVALMMTLGFLPGRSMPSSPCTPAAATGIAFLWDGGVKIDDAP